MTGYHITEEQKRSSIWIINYDTCFRSPGLSKNNFIQVTGIPRIDSSYPSISHLQNISRHILVNVWWEIISLTNIFQFRRLRSVMYLYLCSVLCANNVRNIIFINIMSSSFLASLQNKHNNAKLNSNKFVPGNCPLNGCHRDSSEYGTLYQFIIF